MQDYHKTSYLIFLGGNYDKQILSTEQYLSIYLSKFTPVICFEYPRFSSLLNVVFKKVSLIEFVSKNLIIYHSFGILPLGRKIFPINFFNHLLNCLLLKFLLKNYLDDTTIISFTPEYSLVNWLLKSKNVIYHILDNYTSLPWWSGIFEKVQFYMLERRMVKIADKIIVVSNTLYGKYKKLNQNSFLFPTPINLKYLEYRKNKKNIILKDIVDLPKPIIGFIGTLNDWKINIHLLKEAVTKYPSYSFVFVGTINSRSKKLRKLLNSMPNCYYLGYKALNLLPFYMSNFNTCIIPYRNNSYGEYAYPIKIMEYLAFGKPAVTTALPSIKYLANKKLIYWAKNEEEFIKYIDSALHEGRNKKLVQERIDESKKNDWNIKIKEYLNIIES